MAVRVACVGDSITQGLGTSSSSVTYPSVLGSLLGAGWEVENDGHSGTTLLSSGDFPYTNTSQFAASTAWARSGGDVVIQLGTNDSKPANWANEASFLGDCKALVAHYRDGGGSPRVWISLPPPATAGACCKIDGSVIANEIVPLLRTCAADTGASTIDVHSAFAGHLDWLTDGVHPNDQGAALVAQTVRDAIVRTPFVTLEVSASSSTAPVEVTLAASPGAAYG
jgi:lysophospholipase L1-like esterase